MMDNLLGIPDYVVFLLAIPIASIGLYIGYSGFGHRSIAEGAFLLIFGSIIVALALAAIVTTL